MVGCMNTPITLRRLAVIGAAALASTLATSSARAEVLPEPPSAPQDVAVAQKGTRVTVSWKTPATSGAYPIDGYTASTTTGDHSCVTKGLSCTITGLVPGQTYAVAVRADSGAGLGALSEKIAIAVPYAFESLRGTTARSAAPAATFATHAVVRSTAGKVHVGLRTPRAANADDQVVRYVVQLFDSSDTAVARFANGAVPGRPVTLSVAAGAGTYRVYVTAQKRGGSKVTWKGPRITVG